MKMPTEKLKTSPEPELPHRSWFAVWRWPRWIRLAMIPLVLAAYLFSCVPVLVFMEMTDLVSNSAAVNFFNSVYLPVFVLEKKSPQFRNVLVWQQTMLEAALINDNSSPRDSAPLPQ